MKRFNIFVTFDLENTAFYDTFYEEVAKIGFFKVIPGKYTSSGNDASLPSTTIFSSEMSENSSQLREEVRKQIKNIYSKIGIKGKFIVIISESWGTGIV